MVNSGVSQLTITAVTAVGAIGSAADAGPRVVVSRSALVGFMPRCPLAGCGGQHNARATIVNVGAADPDVGKTELPATKRFETPCTQQSASTTPASGSR